MYSPLCSSEVPFWNEAFVGVRAAPDVLGISSMSRDSWMRTGRRLLRGQSQKRRTEHNGSDVLVNDSSTHTCWVLFACKGQRFKLHLFDGEIICIWNNLFRQNQLESFYDTLQGCKHSWLNTRIFCLPISTVYSRIGWWISNRGLKNCMLEEGILYTFR